jgi:HK97 family phage prohead protease
MTTPATTKQCVTCKGDGKIKGNSTTCPDCKGTGNVPVEAKSQSIPAVSRKKIPLMKMETRSFHLSNISMRDSDDGTTSHFSGYASTTDQPYDVQDFMGEYTETIRAGAFNKTLRDGGNVPLLFNHAGMPLASTGAGTMTLTEDRNGLRVDADLDRRQTLTNDLCIAMERGDLRQMSFSFQAEKQAWSSDYSNRDVNELRLFDASLVTYPANPNTSASLRADLNAALGKEGRARMLEVAGIMAEVREGKAISAANAELLQKALDALHTADDNLTQVDAALDEGQTAISEALGVTDPDDDDPDEKSADDSTDKSASGAGIKGDGATAGGAGSSGGDPTLPNDGGGTRSKQVLVPTSVLETRALLDSLNAL